MDGSRKHQHQSIRHYGIKGGSNPPMPTNLLFNLIHTTMNEDFMKFHRNKMEEVKDETNEVTPTTKDVFSGEEIPTDADLSEEATGTLADEKELDNFTFPDDLEKPVEPTEPKVKENPNGTYKGFFFTPCDHKQRLTDALNHMAETDPELAEAIAKGEKTFDGCDRFIRNNMADLARECGKREIVFDDNSVHEIARLYMLGYVQDKNVAEVAKKVADKKKSEKKPKAEKPKAETKPEPKKEDKPKAQVVDMFADFF